jgi:hypothetical protein
MAEFKCSNCGGTSLKKDDKGRTVCAYCGTVYSDVKAEEKETTKTDTPATDNKGGCSSGCLTAVIFPISLYGAWHTAGTSTFYLVTFSIICIVTAIHTFSRGFKD